MTLAEALTDPPEPSNPGPSCGFGKWLAGLDDDDRQAVEKAMSDPSYKSSDLWRRLNSHSETFDLSDFTLRRHRRGMDPDDPAGCRCNG